ncbi:MAG: carboxymuconolactone decarboxylase family protein [Acidimicrobiia bacterium]|nr:carboxymuconolactone decarboxylase family protein [Acidimicrobiia bacterium]
MPVTTTVEQPTAELEEIYAAAEAHFGQVPNLVKVLGSNPAFCKSLTAFMIQALGEGRVSWAFKELVILKTLRATGAYYSYGAHEKLAAELGSSPERIGDTNNSLWRSSPHFSDDEKAVFELIEQIAVDANDVGDAIWEPLLAHWDNGQLLEIASIITTFINIGRMGDTLGVSDPVLFTKPVA